MVASAVPGHGRHRESRAVGISRLLRSTGLSLLSERAKSVRHFTALRSKSRRSSYVGDCVTDLSGSCGCPYSPTSATRRAAPGSRSFPSVNLRSSMTKYRTKRDKIRTIRELLPVYNFDAVQHWKEF